MTLEALLKHPALWQGRQQQATGSETLSTGFTELDAVLPANGWPIGALTEIITSHEGIGELTMLMPALHHLTRQQQWTALVAPPHIPYAPALIGAGIALERILVVDSAKNTQDNFWATEQLLRSGIFSSVVLWADHSNDNRKQRRLQLAAEQGKAWAVCYRAESAVKSASPAGLRMRLHSDNQHLLVDIIKNRGGRLHTLKLHHSNANKEGSAITDIKHQSVACHGHSTK